MAYTGKTIKVKKYGDHIEEIAAGGTITKNADGTATYTAPSGGTHKVGGANAVALLQQAYPGATVSGASSSSTSSAPASTASSSSSAPATTSSSSSSFRTTAEGIVKNGRRNISTGKERSGRSTG